MTPNLLFPSLFLSSLIGITLSLADPDVKMNCYPTSCGNITNIHYPFWIPGRQPDYCGFPQFQLNCTDEGILALEGFSDQYQVSDIFYDNQSFIVADAKLAANHCPLPTTNIFSLTPFGISSKNKELYVLFNCSHAHPDNYFRIPCTGDEIFGCIAGGFKPQETEVPNLPKTCGSAVLPVLDTRGLLTTGFLLEWSVASCAECLESKGQCGYNNETESFMCICPDRIHYQSCEVKAGKAGNAKKILIGSVTGIAGILLACLLFCLCRSGMPNFHLKKNEAQNIESFLEKYGSSVPKRYKYSDVKRMTNSFHYKLGQGGFGSVYKGTLRDGHPVAVKVLRDCKGDGEEFVNEVASIGRTSHVNVVSLLGFCSKGSKRALIYDFMCNGSLEKFIYSEAPKTTLGWEKLYEIAIGIARGLEYLHRGCSTRIVHFDIKPHNILLDQDFCPKISDFGLAKLCPQKDSVLSMAGTRGTIGYIAPEVFSRNFGVVSSKSDVYSYGMLVLEMVGGRRNVEPGASNTSEIYFPHWVYEHLDQDGCLQACGVTNETEDIARKMILVGLWCIQTMPQNRPSMGKVIDMLEGNINDLEMPPKPYLSSPLRSVVSSIS